MSEDLCVITRYIFNCTVHALKHHMVHIHRLGKAFAFISIFESNQITVAFLVFVKLSIKSSVVP